jgi:hypothetical protein
MDKSDFADMRDCARELAEYAKIDPCEIFKNLTYGLLEDRLVPSGAIDNHWLQERQRSIEEIGSATDEQAWDRLSDAVRKIVGDQVALDPSTFVELYDVVRDHMVPDTYMVPDGTLTWLLYVGSGGTSDDESEDLAKNFVMNELKLKPSNTDRLFFGEDGELSGHSEGELEYDYPFCSCAYHAEETVRREYVYDLYRPYTNPALSLFQPDPGRAQYPRSTVAAVIVSEKVLPGIIESGWRYFDAIYACQGMLRWPKVRLYVLRDDDTVEECQYYTDN